MLYVQIARSRKVENRRLLNPLASKQIAEERSCWVPGVFNKAPGSKLRLGSQLKHLSLAIRTSGSAGRRSLSAYLMAANSASFRLELSTMHRNISSGASCSGSVAPNVYPPAEHSASVLVITARTRENRKGE
jgi:hypothetical protein